MNSDPSIDILTQRLADADIDPQLRDALASDLDWAAGINGNPDPSMQGVKRLVVCGVRRELLASDRDHKTQVQIAGILSHCRDMHGAADGESGQGEVGSVIKAGGGTMRKFMMTVRVLTPWRWPLALAACSPWSASFVQAIAAVFAK
jgi:hypothetical protein